VEYVTERFWISQKRACTLVNLNRSTCYYKSERESDEPIRKRIRELSERWQRFGSPRLHVMLKREGLVVKCISFDLFRDMSKNLVDSLKVVSAS